MASRIVRPAMAASRSVPSSAVSLRGQHIQPRPLVARRHIRPRGLLQIVNITSNDIKNGTTILIDGAPYRVMEFLHVKPGKGSAFVRSKIRNYLSGNTVEKTFRAGEPLETAVVEKRDAQFTYIDGDQYVFMDLETYEESRIPEDETWSKYLKEGLTVSIVTWEGKTISVDLPNTVELVVAECDPGVKGNTQSGGNKPAKMETGAVVNVPLFIQQGEKIIVNTGTNDYGGRA